MARRWRWNASPRWLRAVVGQATAPDGGSPIDGGRPELTPAGRAELSRVLDVLTGAGVFAPRAPDPSALAEAVADQGEPITAFGVLQGLHEAGYRHPGYRIEDHTARLAFLHDQVEQDAEHLRAQVADLDRLAGPSFAVAVHDAEVTWTDGDRGAPTTVRLTVGGEPRTVRYRGAAKYLSTVIPVQVARELRARDVPVRLAALASDAGMWVAALSPDVDVHRLNDDLRAPEYERWTWLDEQEPHAAGGPG